MAATRKVAMSLLAHPDDAEFLCAGTLIRLADAGWEIHIATATSGDCGSVELPADQIALIRRSEAQAAAKSLGATYHLLGEKDVNVVFDKETNCKAIDLVRRVAPSVLFTHPRFDYMLDHEQTHLLARSAAFAYPIPNASSERLIPGSQVPWLYYCDPIQGTDPYSGLLTSPTCYLDITDQMPRKIEMLACHVSQREWLRSHHGIDEYIEVMKRHGRIRGEEIGCEYAEAFVQHRGHPFPGNDLLRELLG